MTISEFQSDIFNPSPTTVIDLVFLCAPRTEPTHQRGCGVYAIMGFSRMPCSSSRVSLFNRDQSICQYHRPIDSPHRAGLIPMMGRGPDTAKTGGISLREA